LSSIAAKETILFVAAKKGKKTVRKKVGDWGWGQTD
jgi:hypothetical protein